MTGPILPLAPYRISLEQHLIDQGQVEEAAGEYRCGCGRIVAAAGFRDVRDVSDQFGDKPFVCDTCASDLIRREMAEHEEACRLAQEAAGALDEELLNGLRADRDLALARSDWTQLADNRDRLGADLTAAWDAYRASVRAWFGAARDEGVIADFPSAPDGEPA